MFGKYFQQTNISFDPLSSPQIWGPLVEILIWRDLSVKGMTIYEWKTESFSETEWVLSDKMYRDSAKTVNVIGEKLSEVLFPTIH